MKNKAYQPEEDIKTDPPRGTLTIEEIMLEHNKIPILSNHNHREAIMLLSEELMKAYGYLCDIHNRNKINNSPVYATDIKESFENRIRKYHNSINTLYNEGK